MKFILMVWLILISSNLLADISFNWLGSTTKQMSALSGSCKNETDGILSCNLRQISFRKKISTDDAQSQINKVDAEVEELLKETSVKDWINKDNMCSELPKRKDKATDQEIFNKIQELCNNPTKNVLVDFAKHSIQVDANTCLITELDLGNYAFKKVSSDTWISNNGPSGECGVITVMKLKQDSEHLWTYTQNRQYTSLETQMCKNLNAVNETVGFGWNAPTPIRADCKYIEFGI